MIDWAAFGIVSLAALVSASVVVSLFAFGLRLLNVGRGVDSDDSSDPVATTADSSAAPASPGRPAWAGAAAVGCFILCGLAVLYGIYLIVPILHAS
jgi:hypothetical protein